MRKLIVLTILFLQLPPAGALYIIASPPGNFSVLDSLCREVAAEALNKISSVYGDSVYLDIAASPSSWMIEQYLFTGNTKTYMAAGPIIQNIPTAAIRIRNIGVVYSLYPNSRDSLSRSLTADIYLSMSAAGANKLNIPSISRTYTDTISRIDIPLAEKGGHEFAKSEVPDKPPTFFEEIAEPVILITGTLVAVILFFTVRSE